MTHSQNKRWVAIQKEAEEFANKWCPSPFIGWTIIYLAYLAGARPFVDQIKGK